MELSKSFAIIGAGNGGQAFAAYLSLKGHSVKIYDVSQKTVDILQEKGGVLLEEWVDLDLIHHRLDLLVHAQIHQPLWRKVAHPDGPDDSLLIQALHSPPCAIVVTKRLMDQIEIDVIQAQLLQRAVKGFECAIVACVLNP